MDGLVLILILLVLLFIVLPIVAIVQASSARTKAEILERELKNTRLDHIERIVELERKVRKLELDRDRDPGHRIPSVPTSASEPAPIAAQPIPAPSPLPESPPPAPAQRVVLLPGLAKQAAAEPKAPEPETVSEPAHEPELRVIGVPVVHEQAPPPLPPKKTEAPVLLRQEPAPTPRATVAEPEPVRQTARPTVHAPRDENDAIEHFVGAKLFAWAAGLGLFFGLVYFVKWSIDRNLIPPAMRVAVGFLTGAGILAAGMKVHRNRAYTVLAQSLMASGVLMLYGVTFAGQALYHLYPPAASFLIMALTTAAGFLIAVRLEAQVVAVLGMLGGFLTPLLCSTGQDNPGGLFGYIALLDIGLIAVARARRWLHLTALAACGTAMMQAGWFVRFFDAGNYQLGALTWIVIAIFVGFAVLFAGAVAWVRRRQEEDAYLGWSAVGLCASAMFAAFALLGWHSITDRPLVLYTFVLLVNAAALFTAWVEPRLKGVPGATLGFTFLHLAIWTMSELNSDMLITALALYLVFGLAHTAFALLWVKRHPGSTMALVPWMPVMSLLLMVLPVLKLHAMSFAIWPAMLLMNALIAWLALTTRRVLPVLTGMVITLGTALLWLILPAHHADITLTGFLLVVGGFALVFIGVALFLANKVISDEDGLGGLPLVKLLPVFAAVMPFALLTMSVTVLPVANPAPVFGVAALLTVFLLAMTKLSRVGELAWVALLCMGGVLLTWHQQHFNTTDFTQPLLWYAGLHAAFAVFPFLFRRELETLKAPWSAAAASGLVSFFLVWRAVKLVWPQSDVMGLLPLVYALPPLVSLSALLKSPGARDDTRLTQLAWYGAVGLFFITLIFPMQFSREWLTIGWALEGAALCWLHGRVRHDGLRLVAAGLLTATFARLALNGAVLNYHPHGNWWFLHTYGLVVLAQFAAVRLLEPPRHQLGAINLRGLFGIYGGVLLFILLNLTIAHAFTPDGAAGIRFDFHERNLARDMTYSIVWAFYALALLVAGFQLRERGVRLAGIGLMVITLLKLFLHDLAAIDNIYRVIALVVVSLIALAASWLYQRVAANRDPRS